MWLGTTALAPTVAPRADDGPVQDDAARAGQRLVLERAPSRWVRWPTTQPSPMVGREARPGVDDRAVLDGRARPDGDRPVVAAQDGAGPHARLGADGDVADDDGVGVHEGVGVDARRDALSLVDGHGGRRYTWPAIQVTPW